MSWTLFAQIVLLMILAWLLVGTLIGTYFRAKQRSEKEGPSR